MVETKNLNIAFNATKALDNCNFYANKGKITAILGDNGSGKTTLIRTLTGNLKPDSGSIIIEGKEYSSLYIHKTLELGIRCVYQNLALDDCKNSYENIFLGDEPLKYKLFIDRKKMMQESEKLLQKLEIKNIDLNTPVGKLSGGQKQAVALAKALHVSSKILILDEPTSAMGVKESQKTMETLKNLKFQNENLTMLIITHNLFWAWSIADEVAVMQNGKCIAHFETSVSSPEKIHEFMIKGGRCSI